MIQKILVPVDGSELADKALNFALDQAKKYSAEIMLLGVIPPLTISAIIEPLSGGPTISPEALSELEEGVEAYHKKVLSEAMKKSEKSKPRVKISSMLAKGIVSDRILEIAKEGNFDLIVMGSHGLSGFKEFLLGSVSSRVVNNAPCPVLIVK
ncbi:universal stress protein [Candidatus Bathyarchaeota archaeon]|nr:universal stress protein [Candidatus Bathyarchaeota archaeon]